MSPARGKIKSKVTEVQGELSVHAVPFIDVLVSVGEHSNGAAVAILNIKLKFLNTRSR